MHTTWKGSISFGLVNIPVKLFTATENKDIRFRHLHKPCHTPIRYQKTCPTCEEEVEREDIVRGYEYEPGRFIEVKEDELKALEEEKRKAVEILDFVQLEDIDPVYFNRSYFIGPGDNGDKPFSLLHQALKKSGRIGVAKITIRSKEHLAVVRVYRQGLVLETMFYPDEVRSVEHVPGLPQDHTVQEKELGMAEQLIDQLTATFDPEKYKDDYREAVLDLVQGKAAREEDQAVPEEKRENVVDLMDALQASLEETKGGGKKKKKKEPAVK